MTRKPEELRTRRALKALDQAAQDYPEAFRTGPAADHAYGARSGPGRAPQGRLAAGHRRRRSGCGCRDRCWPSSTGSAVTAPGRKSCARRSGGGYGRCDGGGQDDERL